MAFNVLRVPARRAVASVSVPKAQLRTSLRRYTTEATPHAPKGGSNVALFAGLGAAALGGIGYYLYSSDSNTAKETVSSLKGGVQVSKAKANFTPSKEDYQKVRARLNARHVLVIRLIICVH